jgi:hypothetical protein
MPWLQRMLVPTIFYKRPTRRNTGDSQFNNSYRRIAMKIRPSLLVMIIFTGISACSAITPSQPTATPTTTPEIFMPLPADQHAFEVVRATLAANLGVDPLSITLVDEAPVDWPDTCLGLPAIGEMCAQVVTPGFRVRVQAGEMVYEFHTDQDAKNLRQVK